MLDYKKLIKELKKKEIRQGYLLNKDRGDLIYLERHLEIMKNKKFKNLSEIQPNNPLVGKFDLKGLLDNPIYLIGGAVVLYFLFKDKL